MKLLKAIKRYFTLCPKEKMGYTCHHREGECGIDDHKQY